MSERLISDMGPYDFNYTVLSYLVKEKVKEKVKASGKMFAIREEKNTTKARRGRRKEAEILSFQISLVSFVVQFSFRKKMRR